MDLLFRLCNRAYIEMTDIIEAYNSSIDRDGGSQSDKLVVLDEETGGLLSGGVLHHQPQSRKLA